MGFGKLLSVEIVTSRDPRRVIDRGNYLPTLQEGEGGRLFSNNIKGKG